MILPEETYPAIDIFKLIHFILLRQQQQPVSIGDFVIVDVNDKDIYDKQHILEAEHYDRRLLCRNYYSTELLDSIKKTMKAMLIYGEGSANVTSSLLQRGYKAIQIHGNISTFRNILPQGLCYPESSQYDVIAMRVALQKKGNAHRGERLWRSTSSTRIKSAAPATRRRESTPDTNFRKPWK